MAFSSQIVPRRFTVLFAGIIFLSMVVGCSSGGRKIPQTVAVTGTITYGDKPLAGAEVGFVSALNNKDVISAHGVTNDSGEFRLTTYIDPEHEVSGATPGEFVVTVTKNESMDMAKVMEEFKNNPAMEIKNLVPTKYTDAQQSPLKATVTAGGTNRFEFKLED